MKAATALSTCGALMQDAAARHPDADILVLPGDRATYAELVGRATQWARHLIALGVRAGDHVGIFLPNSTEFIEILLGAIFVAAVPVPINTRYRGQELAFLVRDADLVTIVTCAEPQQIPDFTERLSEAFGDLAHADDPARLRLTDAPRLRSILVSHGVVPPGFLPVGALTAISATVTEAEITQRWHSADPEDIALILYTSGSTARPKGCLLSHRALVTQGQLMAERYRMTAADRIWSPLPMFHCAAISPLMAVASVGAAMISMRRVEAGPGLAIMAAERVTIAYVLFQTVIADLLQHADFTRYDFSRVRLMISNLALQPPWIRDMLREKVPSAIQIGTFGLTETVGAACTHALDDPPADRHDRLGRPMPGIQVRVVGEDGQDLPIGAIGEVLLGGATLCSGYYKDAVKTASTLRQGWLHTGDRGSLDESGSVMFHGRMKDVLKVGGENVGALEVETMIGQHPAVQTSAVVGMPDPRLMEVPVAFVELRPGMVAGEADILNFCNGKLASFKIPRQIHFISDWPMSATKIDKPELVRRLLKKE